MTEEYKYKAFISYSHKDKNFAKWLHKRIENYKIPSSLRVKYPNLPKNLERSVFRDEEELPTASELSDNLLHAMDNSQRLIVICSPSSVKSKWVNSEIKYFKHKHGENSILAVIKDGEPNATDMDDEDNEAFPYALRYIVNKEGALTEERTEPIAGDARSYWNREMALMKMIAGILNVDFADLWRREKRERNKRRIITAFIASVFIALVFYASTQFVGDKTNVELENIKTEIVKIEYRIRHDNLTFKELVAINEELKRLKELKKAKEDTLKTLGSLKTSLGKEAQEVYHEKGAGEAIKVLTSRDALSRKEQLKKEFSLEDITLAKLYIETYQFDKALKSYEDAITMFFDFDSVSSYGYFLAKQDKLYKAISLYKKLLQNNLSPSHKLIILRRQATLYRKLHKYKQAEAIYSNALIVGKKIVQKDQGKYNLDYIKLLGSLAVLYRNTNRYKLAEKKYHDILDIHKKSAHFSSEAESKSLAITLSSFAILLRDTKRFKEAEKYYDEAIVIFRKLIQKNKDEYMKSLGITLSSSAVLYRRMGKFEEAKKNYNEAIVIFRKLVEKNPHAYIKNLAITLSSSAKLYIKINDYKKAEENYLEAINILKKLIAYSPGVYIKSFVISMNSLATFYVNTNRESEAKKVYLELEITLRKLIKENPETYTYYLNQTLNKQSLLE